MDETPGRSPAVIPGRSSHLLTHMCKAHSGLPEITRGHLQCGEAPPALSACGILSPRPGIELTPLALEGKVLTTEPSGMSLEMFSLS